jgi:hypothetical protein
VVRDRPFEGTIAAERGDIKIGVGGTGDGEGEAGIAELVGEFACSCERTSSVRYSLEAATKEYWARNRRAAELQMISVISPPCH